MNILSLIPLISNPIVHLDVIDDSKPVIFSYYHGDKLIGTIEVDPLHNNGITISGIKTIFSPCSSCSTGSKDHLIFDDLNNINDVIHINPTISSQSPKDTLPKILI